MDRVIYLVERRRENDTRERGQGGEVLRRDNLRHASRERGRGGGSGCYDAL